MLQALDESKIVKNNIHVIMLSFAEMIVLNIVYNKKKIQMLLLNMALISLVK